MFKMDSFNQNVEPVSQDDNIMDHSNVATKRKRASIFIEELSNTSRPTKLIVTETTSNDNIIDTRIFDKYNVQSDYYFNCSAAATTLQNVSSLYQLLQKTSVISDFMSSKHHAKTNIFFDNFVNKLLQCATLNDANISRLYQIFLNYAKRLVSKYMLFVLVGTWKMKIPEHAEYFGVYVINWHLYNFVYKICNRKFTAENVLRNDNESIQIQSKNDDLLLNDQLQKNMIELRDSEKPYVLSNVVELSIQPENVTRYNEYIAKLYENLETNEPKQYVYRTNIITNQMQYAVQLLEI